MTRKAAITGVGNTKVGEVPGSTCMSLHTEAALYALDDAGLKPVSYTHLTLPTILLV